MKFRLPTIKLERWKYNSKYEVWVSSFGRVQSKNGEDKKIFVNQSGYCMVKIDNHLHSVHRLVLETWRPINKSLELTIDHLDHNKRNNALSNLEWVSMQENQRRAFNDLIIAPAKNHYFDTTVNLHFDSLKEMVDYWYTTDKNIRSIKEHTPETVAQKLNGIFHSGCTVYTFAGHRIICSGGKK